MTTEPNSTPDEPAADTRTAVTALLVIAVLVLLALVAGWQTAAAAAVGALVGAGLAGGHA